MTTILSIDFPWGAQNVVGAALVQIDEGGVGVVAHAVPTDDSPPRGPRDPEIDAFIETGAALGTALPGDSDGPFPPGMPSSRESRERYVDRVASALNNIATAIPKARRASIALIDIPFVPACVATANPPKHQKQANMRPVERAFQCKVRVPVLNADANATNFARFQAGVMRGYRPGYALARVVTHVFGSATILESFPQLVVGALAEMAVARQLPPPLGLTHHKRPPFAGQDALLRLIADFMGATPRWTSPTLPSGARADALDALLGVLPVVPLYGIRPVGSNLARWATPIKLLILAETPDRGTPQRPPRRTSSLLPAHAMNCRHWIDNTPQVRTGIDDSGLFALDLDVWQ